MMGEQEIVGYRFSPSDAELVGHYLMNKIKGNESKVFPVVEVDLCKNEPWDLPKITERLGIRSKSQVWYFFCARVSKYNNSKRANRTTAAGYWKATGKDRNVNDPDTNREIGAKKTLVFYRGRVPNGVRTPWVIHEYRLSDPKQDAYVICKMKKKGSEKTVDSYGDRGEPSRPPVSDNENYAPRNTILEEILQSQVNADDYLASLNDHDVLDHDWHVKLPDEGISLNDLDCSIDLSIDQNGPQQQFYFPDEEEELDPEFVNALFADEDESPHGETVHTFRHGYSQPMSVTGVYFENSSDTDTEILHGRSGRILEATGSSVGSSSSNQHKQMHVEDVFHGDEILKRDSLSELLHTDTPASVEPFVTTNTCKAQYRSVRGFLTQESPKRFQLREHEPALKNQAKEVSKQVTSVDLRKKKISMKNSEKQQKIVKVSDGQNQTIAKGMSSGPVSNDRKGPFIFFEKSQSRHEPSPPSLYFGNVLLGLFLFIIVVREVVYCH